MKPGGLQWHRRLGKRLLAHVAETCGGRPTLAGLAANLRHQAETGDRCFLCEEAARRVDWKFSRGCEMGIPAVATCRWHDYVWDYSADRGSWVHDGSESRCRASVGEKLVTVWLPQGAVIRLRRSRIEKPGEVWPREFRHTYGRDRDRQIRITVKEAQ